MGIDLFRAAKAKGKVHMMRKSRFSGYMVQNCDGRSVQGAVATDEPLTCKRCQEHEHR